MSEELTIGISGNTVLSNIYGMTVDASRYGGWSGESGYSGIWGWSGLSGLSGWSGKSGWSGWSGLSAYSGLSGWSGWSGQSGWSGYPSHDYPMIAPSYLGQAGWGQEPEPVAVWIFKIGARREDQTLVGMSGTVIAKTYYPDYELGGRRYCTWMNRAVIVCSGTEFYPDIIVPSAGLLFYNGVPYLHFSAWKLTLPRYGWSTAGCYIEKDGRDAWFRLAYQIGLWYYWQYEFQHWG